MATRSIAVVGAGLAGLGAAVTLQRSGHRVELFERSRLLGGRATSFEIGGTEVDNGQHVFLGCCTEFIDFVRSVGMADAIYLQPRFNALVFGDGAATGRLCAHALPPPFHLLASLLTYRHLRLQERIRLGRGLLRMMACRAAPQTMSFAAWLAQNYQREAQMRAFWEPFFIPALNAPLERVSAEEGAFVLATAFFHDTGASRFGWSRVPLAQIAAAAAQGLERVHLSTPVTGARLAPDDVVELRIQNEWHGFDGVVLAVSPPQLARILGDPEAFGVRGIENYQPYPIVDVHLWHNVRTLGFEFAALIDSPVQWIFAKAPGYLACSMSAAGETHQPTAELTQRCWEDVQRFVPALRTATLLRSAVTRNPEATFVAKLGTQRATTATTHANVVIAGSWTDTGWPDTMESAVRSGRTAAQALRISQRTAPRSEVTYAS